VSSSSAGSIASENTVKSTNHGKTATTRITIHGCPPLDSGVNSAGLNIHVQDMSKPNNAHTQKESILLTLHPQSHSIASEWLDGLLMLLNQQPITAETDRLINTVSSYGLKIRLLNVRFDERDMTGVAPQMPSREGLDEDYYYDVFGGQ
jgi:engulfment and cell motility protein 1